MVKVGGSEGYTTTNKVYYYTIGKDNNNKLIFYPPYPSVNPNFYSRTVTAAKNGNESTVVQYSDRKIFLHQRQPIGVLVTLRTDAGRAESYTTGFIPYLHIKNNAVNNQKREFWHDIGYYKGTTFYGVSVYIERVASGMYENYATVKIINKSIEPSTEIIFEILYFDFC